MSIFGLYCYMSFPLVVYWCHLGGVYLGIIVIYSFLLSVFIFVIGLHCWFGCTWCNLSYKQYSEPIYKPWWCSDIIYSVILDPVVGGCVCVCYRFLFIFLFYTIRNSLRSELIPNFSATLSVFLPCFKPMHLSPLLYADFSVSLPPFIVLLLLPSSQLTASCPAT